jgi:F-type H+-transporting ATPase subunit a
MILSGLLSRFAESGPTVHITPLEIFKIGNFTITNSILYAWVCSILILILSIVVARMVRVKPRKGFIQFFELGTDFITNLIASAMGSREKAIKYAPYFVSIFFFIVLSNWLGLLPGVGEAITHHGVPVFRPFTADLNGTLAVACVSMFFIQLFSVREAGLLPHLRHYFNGSLKNPMTIFLGLFEILGEFTRIGSLALRLFLNVAIGEIIISVFAYLGKFAAPLTSLPFVILEMLVGALQAYIFVMLSVMYLAVAVKHHEQHESEDHAEPTTAKAGA